MIKTNNYEIAKRQASKLFLQYDQEGMIRRFDLRYDDLYLYLRFFSRDFRVNRRSGQVDFRRALWEVAEPAQ